MTFWSSPHVRAVCFASTPKTSTAWRSAFPVYGTERCSYYTVESTASAASFAAGTGRLPRPCWKHPTSRSARIVWTELFCVRRLGKGKSLLAKSGQGFSFYGEDSPDALRIGRTVELDLRRTIDAVIVVGTRLKVPELGRWPLKCAGRQGLPMGSPFGSATRCPAEEIPQ